MNDENKKPANGNCDYDPFCQHKRPDDGLPWFVHIIVTTRCNLRCKMCISYESKTDLGPKEKVLGFIDRLGDWLPTPRMVIFTGGEPLMHPNIVDFVRRMAKNGFIPSLNTNAALLTAAKVDELVEAGLQVINISLDGKADVHDVQRNAPGLYEGVRDIIQYISGQGVLKLSVVSVISALSAKGLPTLVRDLGENTNISNVRFQSIIPTMGRAWDEGFFKNNPLWPTNSEKLDEVLGTLDELNRMKQEGGPVNNPPSQFDRWREYFQNPTELFAEEVCSVGESNLVLNAQGNVLFCNDYGRLGTLDDDPRVLWESERAEKMREKMGRCKKPCNFFVNCCYLEC